MAAPGSPPARRLRSGLALAALALALVFPWLMQALDAGFYVGVASRIMIYGIAATSLNLVLGYGGLVSFGHAAFVGIGAYAVGISITEGQTAGWIGFPLAVACAAAAAAAIGAVSLRTRGVYFIMITLAFAQMLFYLVNSMAGYGGDEGLRLKARSSFFGLSLKDDTTLYFVVLFFLLLTLLVVDRVVRSRFGRAVLAIRDDELRAEAIGFPTFAIKLVLFALGGALGGLAGALMANQQGYVAPGALSWTESGMLMMMVILGGAGTLLGPLLAAAFLLLLEEAVSAYTVHWQFYVGWVLLAIVLLAPEGIAGVPAQWAARRGRVGPGDAARLPRKTR